MTRLEAILSYTPAQKRDTWIALGSQQVDSTKVFIKGTVVRLIENGVDLNGCLFYITDNFTDPNFSWTGYTLADPATGTIAKDSISHPYLRCILSQADFNAITEDYDPTFIPFEGVDDLIVIPDDEYENILFEVGVPFIAYEELEYTKDQILRNAVWPAMREYFKWCPIIEVQTYPLGSGGRFDIDIPSYAYTCQRAYIIPGFGLDVNSQNPFYRHWAQSTTGLNIGATFGNPYDRMLRGRKRYMDIHGFETYILEKAVRQGAVNYGKRTRIRINIQKGKVTGFANQIGTLELEWALNSTNWNDIPFQRRSEVRDLSKAYIMRGLAMLRQQSPKDSPGVLDVSNFLARATELEKLTIENWRSMTKAVIVRS